ncbi:hypothetical protein BKA01_001565 [Pseudonocardia eucalypti]|nr:hypothetical protein [Pseudonocardia eucalypti]
MIQQHADNQLRRMLLDGSVTRRLDFTTPASDAA